MGALAPPAAPAAGPWRFKKHGAGCEAVGPGLRVDFDFGERREIDGFDAWRLGEFARGRLARYGFTRREAIERAVEEAVAAGLVRVEGPMRYLTRRALTLAQPLGAAQT